MKLRKGYQNILLIVGYVVLMIFIINLTYEQAYYDGMKKFCSGDDYTLGTNLDGDVNCYHKTELTTSNNNAFPTLNLNSSFEVLN